MGDYRGARAAVAVEMIKRLPNSAAPLGQQRAAYDERNLVVAPTFPIFSVGQLRNDLVATLSYRRLTANPPDVAAVTIGIERPSLHVQPGLPWKVGGGVQPSRSMQPTQRPRFTPPPVIIRSVHTPTTCCTSASQQGLAA
jgi:hypothetical protein